ncbi:putative PE-PGRS family protein PE_PGRS54 [Mycobacterium simulans]|nr:putative PE-PGRS family protein PE_PGRS54 [Mycobacterium simulans]
MSFVFAVPEFMDAAAAELSTIGAAISQANAAAALPTTSVVAAGGDEVSVAIAALFGVACSGVSGDQRASGGVSRPIRAQPAGRC